MLPGPSWAVDSWVRPRRCYPRPRRLCRRGLSGSLFRWQVTSALSPVRSATLETDSPSGATFSRTLGSFRVPPAPFGAGFPGPTFGQSVNFFQFLFDCEGWSVAVALCCALCLSQPLILGSVAPVSASELALPPSIAASGDPAGSFCFPDPSFLLRGFLSSPLLSILYHPVYTLSIPFGLNPSGFTLAPLGGSRITLAGDPTAVSLRSRDGRYDRSMFRAPGKIPRTYRVRLQVGAGSKFGSVAPPASIAASGDPAGPF